jgi:translation elongation factor EF-1beta
VNDPTELSHQLQHLETCADIAEKYKELGYTEAQFIEIIVNAESLLAAIAGRLQAMIDPDDSSWPDANEEIAFGLKDIVEAIAVKDACEDGLAESYVKAYMYMFGVTDA